MMESGQQAYQLRKCGQKYKGMENLMRASPDIISSGLKPLWYTCLTRRIRSAAQRVSMDKREDTQRRLWLLVDKGSLAGEPNQGPLSFSSARIRTRALRVRLGGWQRDRSRQTCQLGMVAKEASEILESQSQQRSRCRL